MIVNVLETPIFGAHLIETIRHVDLRGSFQETFARSRYTHADIRDAFVQDNVSRSKKWVLRGMHAAAHMSKLVQVLQGRAYDVIADVRADSMTFLKAYGLVLEPDSALQLYIPAGCLHGFLALEDDTILSYKQSAEYDPSTEFGIAWNDPDLAIAWPLDGATPLLSPKDAQNPTLREAGLL